MTEFTLWDILRNLLLALRWTVVLSLIAFIGGGIVGGLLLALRLRAGPLLEQKQHVVGPDETHRAQEAEKAQIRCQPWQQERHQDDEIDDGEGLQDVLGRPG